MIHYYKIRKDKKLFRRALCDYRPERRPKIGDRVSIRDFIGIKDRGVGENCPGCSKKVHPVQLAFDQCAHEHWKELPKTIETAYKKGHQQVMDEEDKNFVDEMEKK